MSPRLTLVAPLRTVPDLMPVKPKRQTPTRARLDAEKILDAACELADREGAEAVTLRRLGTELGADPTAIYRHFRSKDELIAAMAGRLFHAAQLTCENGETWRVRLRLMMEQGLDMYRRNAGMAFALARQPELAPELTLLADQMLGVLRDAGLSDREAALTYHSLVDVIVGTGLYFAVAPEPTTDTGRASLRRAYATLPAETHPHANALAGTLFPAEAEFLDFLIDLILDGVERRIAESPSQGV